MLPRGPPRCAPLGGASASLFRATSLSQTRSLSFSRLNDAADRPTLRRDLPTMPARTFSVTFTPPASNLSLVSAMRKTIAEKGLFAAEISLRDLVGDAKAPSVNVCAVLMQEYARLGAIEKMHLLASAMQASNLSMDRHCYNHFLTLYATVGDISKMEQTFKEMKDKGHRTSGLTYKALVSGYTKALLLDKSVRAFNEMRKSGFAPDVKMHNQLLVTYVRVNKAAEAELLLHSMQRHGPKPDVVSFNSILNHFAKHRLSAPLLALWTEMETSGVKSDSRTFAILIEALARPQHWKEAAKVIAEVTKRNVDLDTILVNVLIDAYGRGGHIEPMWRLYRGMRASDLHPTAATFTSMAAAHATAKDLAGLRRVYDLALAAKMPPNAPFFTAVLSGFSKLGATADYELVRLKLAESKEVLWDAPLGAVLAAHEGRSGRVVALRELERDLASKKVTRSPRLLAALTAAYVRAKDFVAGIRIYDEAIALGDIDQGLQPPLISALAASGRLEEMERVFADVPKERYAQLDWLVMTMTNALKAAGRRESAEKLQTRVQAVIASMQQPTPMTEPPREPIQQ